MSVRFIIAAAEAPILEVETAVLILAVVGLVLLARAVMTLKVEVAALKRTAGSSPAAPAKLSAPAPQVSSGEIPPQIRAAIAAAIHATHGHTHRIVSVAPVQSLLWSREGRRQVFDSHRVR
jgi:hypothetical protein